jgi:amino acid adenylation domain-containing protein
VAHEPGLAWIEVAQNQIRYRAGNELGFMDPSQTTAVGFTESTGSAPPLSEAELHKILVEWNNTAVAYPADRCVHELVEAQAARTPDAIAVIEGKRQLTYRELNQRANQLAHLLREKGIAREIPVGICLRRSLELAVSLLGVMKAGGACLPLDPEYPQDRLAYMLEDSQAPVLITQPELLDGVAAKSREILHFSLAGNLLDGMSVDNLGSGSPDDLAYIIYTSGSTGQPRGVMLAHRGFVNHNTAAVKLYDIRPTDRVLQFASISFDIAVEEILPTWVVGGALVFRPDQMSLAGADFLRFVKQQRISVLDLPTAYWHELVRELAESGAKLPECLRILIVGGEKASSSAFESWLKAGGDRVRWFNTYGPTETSVIATSYEPDPKKPFPSNLPIGRPIANTRLYILDTDLQPVPIGAPGELHIGGPGVARGYWNRPERTAEKFIHDPFSPDPGARLYKTGDLVRYLPDGNIEFIGRTDFQVKIRGFRVELGEIDAVLEKHPGVAGAVVLAHENNGEKRLSAYIVPAQPTPKAADLRTFLKNRLPEYMVPASFVFLESFPLTPNGKVDRRALPAPQHAEAIADDDFVAPRNDSEARMAKIWEQVLAIKPISIHSNFFELGGHSLLAIRLLNRVEKEFGRKLMITALLQAPTVEKLTAVVLDDSSALWSAIVAMQPEGSRPPLYFVHGLGGTVMRFHDISRQMAPDQPFYGIQAQGLDGKRPVLDHVEDMAELYLKDLREAQPEGPYYLGGYSFGGLVALEMAQRLRAEGQDVALLAMVDTYVVGQPASDSLVQRFFALSFDQKIAYVKRRATRYRKGIKRRFDMLNMPAPLKAVREACARAEQRYRPQAYSGSIALFRATDKGLRGLDGAEGGWRKYALGGVEIHEIEGDHGNIVNEPKVRELAAAMKAAIDRAHSERAEGMLAGELS